MRRMVCEGVNEDAESQREEYSVREASEVSSKMPREMSSEVVPLRLTTLFVRYTENGRRGVSTLLSSADALNADKEFWFVDVVAAICEALERH
jgi:hypothetical protein